VYPDLWRDMRHIQKKLATSAVENVALHSRFSFISLASKINVMSGCGNHAFSTSSAAKKERRIEELKGEGRRERWKEWSLG